MSQTMIQMQRSMATGEATARSLAEGCFERIARLDRRGPAVNAVIELNPDALAVADALDEERRFGRTRGPMHGIPILIKDNIDTCDRMQTTAGSLALEGSIAPRDAFIVMRLREAGAVILGKTNLSEWANFRGERSVSGWSSRGGLTRNPYALDRSASGSSSGSAAAVAADLCAAAVGTETFGSIISPSQVCGIVGLKPTVGLVSRSGVIPIAHSRDTAGPMARTVADAAILLGALTGVDQRDAVTGRGERHAQPDYSRYLDEDGLRGARLGVARAMAGFDPHVLAVFETCLGVLKELGAVVVEPVEMPSADELWKAELEVLHYEFKADMKKYLAVHRPETGVRTLADVIRFNEDHEARVMPYFGQELLITSSEKGSLTSEPYRQALATSRRLARREGIDAALRKHDLTALVAPSGGPAWTIDLVNCDPPETSDDVSNLLFAAVAGYPHITVPAGHVFGLPLGISFIAKAWQEPTLIRLAYAFERATSARRPPRFLAHAELPGRRDHAGASQARIAAVLDRPPTRERRIDGPPMSAGMVVGTRAWGPDSKAEPGR